MSEIGYYFNYISNIIGFPDCENQINIFKDLLNKLSSEYVLNFQDDTESFHLIISFWITHDVGVGVSKKIKYAKKNKMSEVNVSILLPSKKDVEWGIKSKKKNVKPVDSRYFDFIELEGILDDVNSLDDYFLIVCEQVIDNLDKNNILSSKTT